jgi:nicotinate-nucleotide--dimethylbenzimidazole phosphoribosyltransferase
MEIRVALVALDEVGVGNTALAAPLMAALLGVQPAAAVGLGAGADTEMLDRKVVTVTAALRRAEDRYGDELLDPLVVLRALGGLEFAVLTGVTRRAAEGGAVIVLDGLATSVAALIATQLEPGVASHSIRRTAQPGGRPRPGP